MPGNRPAKSLKVNNNKHYNPPFIKIIGRKWSVSGCNESPIHFFGWNLHPWIEINIFVMLFNISGTIQPKEDKSIIIARWSEITRRHTNI